ncbi:hypothetical protein [Sphingomonas endolithica]|uniref:hypothetical protein n=1 Tax=Sphingomonas endolithica TaxID=2972485 RepID=UPI0021AF7332|nr:hypothetical protein [Sphingomonas sp. ZFBP2030]
MIRRDPIYWQRLRKDRRSGIAGILTAIALVAATVSVSMILVSGSQYEARANPLYWALMLPMAWWVNGLTAFEPFYVRSWKAVLALACLASGASLAIDIWHDDDWTVSAVNAAVTVVSAIASMIAYRGSLVAREGPAR